VQDFIFPDNKWRQEKTKLQKEFKLIGVSENIAWNRFNFHFSQGKSTDFKVSESASEIRTVTPGKT